MEKFVERSLEGMHRHNSFCIWRIVVSTPSGRTLKVEAQSSLLGQSASLAIVQNSPDTLPKSLGLLTIILWLHGVSNSLALASFVDKLISDDELLERVTVSRRMFCSSYN